MPDKPRNLQAGEMARRIDLKDLPGVFHKSLVLEEGSRGLLLRGGKHDVTLRPGTYRYDSGKAKEIAVVIVWDAPLPLQFTVERALTGDPLPVTLECQLTVQLQEPVQLFANLMREQKAYLTEQLGAALQNEVDAAVRGFMQQHTMYELQSDPSLKQGLEHELAFSLDRTLSTWGFKLAQLRTLNGACEAWDKITQKRVEYAVQATEEEARLQGRKRLAEVMSQVQLQELAEETGRTEILEKRTQLWERMRRATVADRMSQVRTDVELEDFLRQTDRDKLLKDSELEDLKRTLAQAREDREKAYEFLKRRTEMEREFEVKRLELSQRRDLSTAEITFELEVERQRLEGRWQIELRQLDLQLQKRRMEEDFRREQEAAEAEARNQREIEEAKKTRTVGQLEWEQIMAEARGGIALYDEFKGVKIRREHERRLNELGEQEQAYELDRRRKDDELRRGLEEMREKHRQEMERIESVSKLSIEAMITIADSDKAPFLAELAKTKALAGCTPQQILAMQGTPQAAEALKEVMQALSATRQFEQYERLVAEVKEGAKLSREDYQRNLAMMQQMFGKALDSVKETAVAFAPARA